LQKRARPLAVLKEQALNAPLKPDFASALRTSGTAFICEVKKASPSKGIIAADFPYLQIAQDYEKAGAAAISVLTEPFYFFGSDAYLKEIADTVSVPVLRKDFVVDEYMLYEAKALGASAVLLIAAILSAKKLSKYLALAKELGLSALVETHDAKEVKKALKAGAAIIGVNNRDLKTFKTDLATTESLRALIPSDVIFVSESGIKTREDIVRLENAGVNAVLIGETLMKAPNKLNALKELRRRT